MTNLDIILSKKLIRQQAYRDERSALIIQRGYATPNRSNALLINAVKVIKRPRFFARQSYSQNHPSQSLRVVSFHHGS